MIESEQPEMRRSELLKFLEDEVAAWASKKYKELKVELATPVSYETEREGRKYTVEVQVIEDTPDYIHVSLDVDDGSIVRTVLPLVKSFLVYRDGRVDA